MHLCYIDESGCTSDLPTATSPLPPVLIIGAIVIPHNALRQMTFDFLQLKRTFFPHIVVKHTPFLGSVLVEVKGAEVRKNIALGTKNVKRHAIGFLDKIVDLLIKHNIKMFGRAWIKGIGIPIDGTSMYTSSVQYINDCFQQYLSQVHGAGVVIADSRNPYKNARVSHSIFTQKFKVGGDPYSRVLEMPTFGHSENHVGIQIADLVCSAFLFPMAVYTYCTGHIRNVHVRPGYSAIKIRYGTRLEPLLFRFKDSSGRWRGGITVDDKLTHRPSVALFR